MENKNRKFSIFFCKCCFFMSFTFLFFSRCLKDKFRNTQENFFISKYCLKNPKKRMEMLLESEQKKKKNNLNIIYEVFFSTILFESLKFLLSEKRPINFWFRLLWFQRDGNSAECSRKRVIFLMFCKGHF